MDKQRATPSVQIIHAIDAIASLAACGYMVLLAMLFFSGNPGMAALLGWGAYACSRWAYHCARQAWRGEWWL